MKFLARALALTAVALCVTSCAAPGEYRDLRVEWYLGFPSAEENSIVWTFADGQVTRVETHGDEVTETTYPAPDPADVNPLIDDFIDSRNDELCPDANRVTVEATDGDGNALKETREQCDREGKAVGALLDAIEAA